MKVMIRITTKIIGMNKMSMGEAVEVGVGKIMINIADLVKVEVVALTELSIEKKKMIITIIHIENQAIHPTITTPQIRKAFQNKPEKFK